MEIVNIRVPTLREVTGVRVDLDTGSQTIKETVFR